MIFYFVSLVTYLCFLILKFRTELITLADNNYDAKAYINYIIKNPKKVFLTPELLAIILIVIDLNAAPKIMGVAMIIFYTIMFLYELKITKGKIKIDKKQITIIVPIIIIYLVTFTWFTLDYSYLRSDFLIYDATYLYYIITILMGYLSSIIITFSTFITIPIRKLIKHK